MKDTFLAWAWAALEQFPLRDPTIRFLGHSDNLTFRVEEPDGTPYLLRLHRPALEYWAGIRQIPEVIAAELAWMEALAGEGGFTLQKPIHTRAGALVAMVEAGGALELEEAIPATLLTWLEGVHFSPSHPHALAQVERFGAMTARLHAFSAGWCPPGEALSIRPRYDYAHFEQLFARLLRGLELGVFSEEVHDILRATCGAVLEEISALPSDPNHWGMVHADLHMGNFLIQGEEVIPIDFSFCGFGHYLFDASVCLAGGLNHALRPAFLAGYRSVRPLPEADLRPAGAYALASRLSYYAYQVDNPAERAWLQPRMAEFARGLCAEFLRGETIFTGL